ncbi:uncharacterized protein DUF4307 [Mumia flava]|uniref:Uncharacterized protein DUF4307 n=1 Tax=Mumia flava TaxID=1348852 RepID=A0A0B2B318_9ACTN|nr:DUF4307 domain-containing protein [Mumia flava]PJJ56806.1 uncharacterized protein DUF4307 [Mumia flava]
MSSTPSDLSTSRYGRRTAPGRRFWIVLAVVGVGLGVLGSWWLSSWQQDQVTAAAKVVAYDVLSDHQIEVTIDAFHVDGRAAECDVAAQAVDHTYVGERTIAVPAADDDRTSVREVIDTERRAVSADVTSCRLTD